VSGLRGFGPRAPCRRPMRHEATPNVWTTKSRSDAQRLDHEGAKRSATSGPRSREATRSARSTKRAKREAGGVWTTRVWTASPVQAADEARSDARRLDHDGAKRRATSGPRRHEAKRRTRSTKRAKREAGGVWTTRVWTASPVQAADEARSHAQRLDHEVAKRREAHEARSARNARRAVSGLRGFGLRAPCRRPMRHEATPNVWTTKSRSDAEREATRSARSVNRAERGVRLARRCGAREARRGGCRPCGPD
jgi:hypothetical protein